jgi:hypothetical protein
MDISSLRVTVAVEVAVLVRVTVFPNACQVAPCFAALGTARMTVSEGEGAFQRAVLKIEYHRQIAGLMHETEDHRRL